MRWWDNELVCHYTSQNIALEHILPSATIRLNSIAKTNDPRETSPWMFTAGGVRELTPQEFFERHDLFARTLHSYSFILSTSMDRKKSSYDDIGLPEKDFLHKGFGRPYMWAHYGQSHEGICLAFDRQRLECSIKQIMSPDGILLSDEVIYDDRPLAILDATDFDSDSMSENASGDILSHILKYQKILFFTKTTDWEAESEWRWIYIGQDEHPVYASINSCLRAIIVGSYFPDVYKPILREFARKFDTNVAKIRWEFGLPYLDNNWIDR
ncbi:DUF2971 domain-containing protein [Sediminibacterium sp.]|uniref:DUF2971 domain-containing protein n=1 Tax=Sediminibacterium sp. TaxID=1917865 RepID=UPI003F69A72F